MKNSRFFTTSFKNKLPIYLAEFKNQYAQRKSHKLNSMNIHVINNNSWYNQNDIETFLNNNDFIKKKKIISISPGGYKGFYVLGICKYIKENYDLDDFIFTGASAGAWNSLILCYKHDINNLIEQLVDDYIQNATNIHETEQLIKKMLLQNYNSNDFDLRRLFIGVTTINNYQHNTTIFSGFDNLEDAVNCCIASSHIPLVTGGLKHVYQNLVSFDGGFSKYPYLNISTPVLHITPSIWEKNMNNKKIRLTDYTTLFSKNKFIFRDMVDKGYHDTYDNKEILDKTFLYN
jgi:hypothetical protein